MNASTTESGKLAVCLWFDDQAEEAAHFYTTTLPNGAAPGRSFYPETFDNPGKKPRGSLLTVEFEVGGQRFTALNGGPQFHINPSISFFVRVKSAGEAEALAGKLGAGGRFLMPLDRYPWAERYAWVEDRYGVSWQVLTDVYGASEQRVVPCLMFANTVHGRAEEAIRTYVENFPRSTIESIEHYGPDRGPEGKVVHSRFDLGGSKLSAMDSHEPGGASFSEALSIEVHCQDQAEVDFYWGRLCQGGEPGPCGWLTDR